MSARLAALGDSFSCGEGVGIRIRPNRTWPALLADATGLTLHSLAVPGARVRDVRSLQVPQTPPSAVATVMVGLNDICRGGFDPDRFGSDLAEAIGGLHWRAHTVLLARLTDPSRFLWVPKRFRGSVLERLDVANRAIDSVAARSARVVVLDLDAVAELRTRHAWAVDRVHPGERGHHAIAGAAAESLGASLDAAVVNDAPPLERSGATRHAWWLARHGTFYAMRKGHTFVRPIAEGLRRAG